jgi:hypothetical protein
VREPVDILVDATLDAVADTGMVESSARMGTVTQVDSGGTVTVSVAEGSVPKVRVLGQFYAPVVGDVVEVLRTRAGWVCLGKFRTATTPVIQSGTATTPTVTVTAPAVASWSTVTVTFPKPFATVPRVTATPAEAFVSGSTSISFGVSDPTTTNFVLRSRRVSGTATNISAALTLNWIATNL